ncbi:glycosyltransferase family 2 protein [Paenibacillus herberti]|nr:glycosyltransferase family 2 protein [Paenibacillus herberti]
MRSAKRAKRRPSEADKQQYKQGLRDGYVQGQEAGRQAFGVPWLGTSIIIPTFDKCDYLSQCIDSILAHTPEPYEIIVVDNASTDGTAQMLVRLIGKLGHERLRWGIMEHNAGFAAAVNRGMMMARGEKLLLLNNDTIVTERWLENMTACLEQLPDVGIVGPVTNFISGSQLVSVPYETISGMHKWARKHNEPDPDRWRETDRLTGFCMLMRRELMGAIGYFDEGYAIGNYEDDDYGLRTRLNGLKLVIAGDSFIHHYGNVSIRGFGSRMEEITRHNRSFFQRKWEHADAWIEQSASMARSVTAARNELQLYPGGIAASGADGTLWWLENGCRWKIIGEWPHPAIRLAMPLLRRLRVSLEPILAEQAVFRWHGDSTAPPLPEIRDAASASEFTTAEASPADEAAIAVAASSAASSAEVAGEATGSSTVPPSLVMLPSDSLAYVESGQLRLFLNQQTVEDWGLSSKPVVRKLTQEEAEKLPVGLLIISPPQLLQRL